MRNLHNATKSRPHSPQVEKSCEQQRRPNAAKKKKKSQVKGGGHRVRDQLVHKSLIG